MCTLIIGYQVVGPHTVVMGANRDEDPGRPSDPPGLLRSSPRVIGGRDRQAGGTWLALREQSAAVAILNRRPRSDRARSELVAPETPRSRGLLTLDVASVVTDRAGPTDDLAQLSLARALRALAEARYAPFSLAFVTPEGCWVLSHDPGFEPNVTWLEPGWHVITHDDIDDRAEPRTVRLMDELSSLAPRSPEEAEQVLVDRLKLHGSSGKGPGSLAAVCIHEGRMVTVSFSTVFLAPQGARYGHGEGRPCEQALVDCSGLLGDGTPALENT